MHAERDHLVRMVFPELKERCRKRHIHLVDVDLRWGVSEAEVLDGKTLDICLDEIDSCRPYFLGILGFRYGSVLRGDEYSITAREIYHGVLHDDAPKQVVDLRQIIDGKLGGIELTDKQIHCLTRCYRFDPDRGKHLLKEDVTAEELKVIRSAFKRFSAYQRDRNFFFFRSESLTKKMAGSNVRDFFEEDKDSRDKQASLKEEIRKYSRSFDYDDIDRFGQLVLSLLWNQIEAESEEASEEDDAEYHELFAADRTRRFVGRRHLLDKLISFCRQDHGSRVLVVAGEPGVGKSALMSRFYEEALIHFPDRLIIPHFVGAADASASLRKTLQRFCLLLNRTAGSNKRIPEDFSDILRLFQEFISGGITKDVLIILDAVNQFEELANPQSMAWLPQKISGNVRIVISTPLNSRSYVSLLNRHPTPEIIELRGLEETEIKDMVTGYLTEIRHKFPNEDVEKSFYEKIKVGNPLYILIALEELRVFGHFEDLPKRIRSLPASIPELFVQVLERIGADFSRELVRDFTLYLACSRRGMMASELQELLKKYSPSSDSVGELVRLPDIIWTRLYRAFKPYLFERSHVIDFFHGQMEEAVNGLFLSGEDTEKGIHETLSEYFEKRWKEPYPRALSELPFHLHASGRFSRLDEILSSLPYLDERIAAGQLLDLIEDYRFLEQRNDQAQKTAGGIQKFLIKQAHLLGAYPRILFTLVMNEAEGPFREAAEGLARSGGWHKPWFRLTKKWSSARSGETEGPKVLEILGVVDLGHIAQTAVAPDPNLTYFTKGRGIIGMADLSKGQISMDREIEIDKNLVLGLSCSADGRYLSVAYEGGKAELIHVRSPDGENPFRYSIIHDFPCLLPGYERPVVAFSDEGLVYQEPSGTILEIRAISSGVVAEKILYRPPRTGEELSGLASVEGAFAMTFRVDGGTRLVVRTSGEEILTAEIEGADVSAVCGAGANRVATALKDKRIRVYDFSSGGLEVVAERWANEKIVAVVHAGEELLWIDRFHNLFIWNHGTKAEPSCYWAELNALIEPKALAMRRDGTVIISTPGFIVSALPQQSAASTHDWVNRILQTRSDNGFVCLLERPGEDILLANGSRIEKLAGPEDDRGLLQFDYDPVSDKVLACFSEGSGFFVDPETLEMEPISGLPEGCVSVSSDPDGGFWLMTIFGEVGFLEPNGNSALVYQSDLAFLSEPNLRCWGGHPGLLVISGLCRIPTGQISVDFLYTVAFLQISDPGHSRHLKHLGVRSFSQTGQLNALARSPLTDELILKFSDHFRQGTPGEFVAGKEKIRPAKDIDEGCTTSVVSPDESEVYFLSKEGHLFLIDALNCGLVGTVAGTVPVTSLPPRTHGQPLLVIKGGNEVHQILFGKEK